ncbi:MULTISPECIES: helix-turn-helix domain-containing protein [unclassified Butyrivibrio]|uniref:helix-turn-helix domain-containing protein n=1 Tax=unclassified Butyrivibrio TaxID=2639466 RepID=UPI0003B3D31B|nr:MULTISPECIES: helix-turn-helix transcriptional regulator [unclassified Butyrivibrio]SDB32347.1 Transcriptional regulator, contains XRE-family HTH domain [Butyrivibrio sp. INlla16]SEL53780.1 Transcriptional regulator, contains XRE-family HTH domain [Butyrivibrio sp. ob235]
MNITEEIGNRVRFYRKEKNLSQEELALQSDLHPSYIGQLERGVKTPSVNTIYKITKTLDISMSDFMKNIETIDTAEDSYAMKSYLLIEQETAHDQRAIFEIVEKILSMRPKKPNQ